MCKIGLRFLWKLIRLKEEVYCFYYLHWKLLLKEIQIWQWKVCNVYFVFIEYQFWKFRIKTVKKDKQFRNSEIPVKNIINTILESKKSNNWNSYLLFRKTEKSEKLIVF